MTDAPERIWARYSYTAYDGQRGLFVDHQPHEGLSEYIRADLAKPKVKPLVWSVKGYAPTPFGKYLVVCEEWTGEDEPFWFLCFAGKPYAPGGEHGTEEDAKAAAQADYERRIFEVLE